MEPFQTLERPPLPCVWWELSWDDLEWRSCIRKRGVILFGKGILSQANISWNGSNLDNCAFGQVNEA
jgi:hypothetical protein